MQKQKGEDSAREQEAEYIAGLIEEMIHSGYQVSDHGGDAPGASGDICILLRSVKDKAGVYLQALEKRGISGIGENGGGYLYSREISAGAVAAPGGGQPPAGTSTWLLPCSRRWRPSPR